jgi:hypothetical protein
MNLHPIYARVIASLIVPAVALALMAARLAPFHLPVRGESHPMIF